MRCWLKTTAGKPGRAMPSSVILIVLLLWAGLWLRLYRIDVQNIWWDEARNIDVASRPWTAIAGSPELDIHPPLYFYLLHAWMGGVGRSEFAVRALSAFLGMLSAPLLFALGRRVAGQAAARLALATGALAPFFLAEAQETRMYTATFVALLVAAYCLLRALEPGRQRRWWIAYSLAASASLLTHYSAVFVLAPWQGWILLRAGAEAWRGQRRAAAAILLKAFLAGVGMILLFLPQAPIALRQIPTYRNPTLTIPPVAEYLLDCAREFIAGPALALAEAAPWLWGIAGGGAAGLALLVLADRGRKDEGHHDAGAERTLWGLAFLILWLAGGLVVYYVTLLDRSTFHPRYISFVTPALYALIAAGLAGWWRARWPLGLAATLTLASVVIPAVRADQFDERFFREDTAGLAAWLQREATPDDLILIDVPYPLGVYYPRFGKFTDPPPEPADLAPARYLFVDIHTAAERLSELAAGRARLFWVRWFKSDTDPRGVILFLLDKYAQRLGEHDVRGYHIDIYRLPPTSEFELAPTLEAASVRLGPVALTGIAFGGRGGGPTSTLEEARQLVVPADKMAWAALAWQRVAVADRPYKVTLYLEDAFGQIVGQDDRTLLNDRHLTLPYWDEGETALNVYTIALAVGSPPGVYTLKAAIYDPATGQRVDRLDAAGAPQGADVAIGTIEVVPPRTPPAVERLGSAAVEPTTWGGVTLLGADLPAATAAPGADLLVRLYWRADGPTSERSAAEVRLWLRNPSDGRAWSALREAPVGGRYPFASWGIGEVVRDTHRWRIDPRTPAGEYEIYVALAADDGAESAETRLGTIKIEGWARQFTAPAFQHPVGARLGEVAELLGYDVVEPATAGDRLNLTLYWRAIGPSTTPLTVFVHILDDEGKVRGQVDRMPGDGAYPTTGWLAGEVVSDPYSAPIDATLPSGRYAVEVGLYDAATGARLPVVGADGQALGDRILLAPVTVNQAARR